MNTANDTKASQLNDAMIKELSDATAAAAMLAQAGICVFAVLANGRRPLLMVDRLPADIPSTVKRHHPNGMGGTTFVRAASYHGCQLEWMHDTFTDCTGVLPAREVARG